MKALLFTLVLASTPVFADDFSVETIELRPREKNLLLDEPRPGRLEQAERVIASMRDIVAVGREIYELVKDGRPVLSMRHSPINVLPINPATRQVIEAWELEGASLPVERTFETRIKQGPLTVATFRYRLQYSSGASFNGAGKYLTNVTVEPVHVRANFGWSVSSNLKLVGLINHGTRTNPVVGATMQVRYSGRSLMLAFEKTDTIHITGRGEVRISKQ
jgi:hypothetical protein